MELSTSVTRKQWRALVKKLRRKRIRQKAARERDKKLQDEEEAKKHDPAYQEWLQQQSLLEEFQREADERQQQYLESQWQRREHIAQQQFALERQRQLADEATREAERLRMEKELEECQERQRKQLEEKKLLAQQAAEEFESMLKLMYEFLADPEMEVPAELRRFAESHPGRALCQVFERTNCCRFGLPCVNNHRRPMLARVLFIRHFFSHPQLEQLDQTEYGTDVLLEYSDDDMSAAYAEFFADVVPELESFGTIVNIRTASNTQPYLRGHMFVEYTSERAALNAFIKLQGRYYAKKRLNVEFSNIVVWRKAVCGLNFIRKCPQGRNCLYLHLFRNPGNRYNTQLEVTKPCLKTPSLRVTPLISWNDLGQTPNSKQSEAEHPRNWRWSESPEIELKSSDKSRDSHVKHSQTSRNKSEDKGRSRSDSKHRQSSRSRINSHKDTSKSADNKERSTSKGDKSTDLIGSRSRSPNRHHSNNYAKDKTNRRRSRDRNRSRT